MAYPLPCMSSKIVRLLGFSDEKFEGKAYLGEDSRDRATCTALGVPFYEDIFCGGEFFALRSPVLRLMTPLWGVLDHAGK